MCFNECSATVCPRRRKPNPNFYHGFFHGECAMGWIAPEDLKTHHSSSESLPFRNAPALSERSSNTFRMLLQSGKSFNLRSPDCQGGHGKGSSPHDRGLVGFPAEYVQDIALQEATRKNLVKHRCDHKKCHPRQTNHFASSLREASLFCECH